MGLIANKHLAKLWDFMTNYNYNPGDHSVDIFEAFLECDEALSELQDQYEHWKTMYGNACGDQDVLKESIRLLDTENRRLRQQVSDQEKEIEQRRKEVDGLYKALDQLQEENEKLKNLHFDVVAVNHKTIDQLQKKNETMKHVIDDFTRFADATNKSKRDAEKEIDELKKDCAYMTNSRDTWRSRAKHAEKEVEDLNKLVGRLNRAWEHLRDENEDPKKKLMEVVNDILEGVNRDRNDWRRLALTTKLPDVKEEYEITFTIYPTV